MKPRPPRHVDLICTAALVVIIAALSRSSSGQSTDGRAETTILSAGDHERVYASQKQSDDFRRYAEAANQEIFALSKNRDRPKGEFETTEEYDATKANISKKIAQIGNEISAAANKANHAKDVPLPARMIATWAYVTMGAYDADTSKIADFSSPIPAEGGGSDEQINDPFTFGDEVQEKRQGAIVTESYFRVVSVKGAFEGIKCPPLIAKKIREASGHHQLLAKVLIPIATTTCKRTTVSLHHPRLDDIEPGFGRLRAAAKMFVSRNSLCDAEVIQIEAKGSGQILELQDAADVLWKAQDH